MDYSMSLAPGLCSEIALNCLDAETNMGKMGSYSRFSPMDVATVT